MDLANYVPSSSLQGVFSLTQFGKNGGPVEKDSFVGFAKNESLYRRISTKYKSSKLFWRIVEDNKQNRPKKSR